MSKALAAVLREAAPAAGFVGAAFDVYHASQFQSPMADGVSVYLYRVLVSTTRGNLPARVGGDGRLRKPPLPVDLHYLVTPWAQTAERQHLLLGWAMRTFADSPILPAAWLNQQIADTFNPDEGVEIVPEAPSLQDMVNVWEVAKSHVQVSVAYSVRVVPIDSAITQSPPAPVQTRAFDARGRASE